MSQQRLLFLSQTLPYPPDGGVNIRTHHILRLLASEFDVTALCFYRARERPTRRHVEESVAALNRIANVEAFEIPQEHSRARLLWDHVRSVVRGRAYTEYAYASAPFRGRVQQLLRDGQFDLVHVDSLDLAGYLPLIGSRPIACVHHNIESMLLRRRSMVEQARWKREYVTYQAGLVEKQERHWCGRVALNVLVSPTDAEALAELAPGARMTVIPNGVDTDYFRPRQCSENGIVCVGGITGFANHDALDVLCRDILPLLREWGLSTPAHWVGRAPEGERRSYRERYGVELTGYVDDVRPFVQQAACYAVPLRVGGGTRVKIVDAWAMGKAVVSTSIGCEGLDAVDGQNILIRDTPREFALAVRDVLQNAELRRRLGEEARRTVERRYAWDVIAEHLLAEYHQLLEDQRPADGFARRATA